MNGADLIAAILQREGVEVLPAFPHSDLIEAAAKIGIRPIIVRQERQALHIADGYTRATGGRRNCVSTVQYGPGSENAAGGVAQCFADNSPVLHIPGGYPIASQGVSPNFNAARSLQSINKWCEFVHDAERLPQMLQHAFAQLRNGRPGPVTLEVPVDIFSGEVDGSLVDRYRPQRKSSPCADVTELRELVDMLLAASSPVIVAGQGILYAGATKELVELAELTQTPVMSTLNGKSCFPENHALSLGCGGLSRPDAVVHFLNKCDLIIGLGTSFTRSEYITPLPLTGRRFAQLTNSESDISKDYPVDFAVIGDARPSIAEMNAEVKLRLGDEGRRAEDSVRKEIAALKAAFLDEWRPLLECNERPINPYRVVWDLMHCLDRTRTVVSHEAGSPRDQITPFYEAIVPHGYIGWGKTTQLGTSLGLVQGAKLARPDWHAVNIMGESAMGMVGMDFETSVRNRIGTTTIVLRNGVMGNYTNFHPVASEKYEINKLGGNYADLASALGGYAERIEDPTEITPAIKRALARNDEGEPALLEFITAEENRKATRLPDDITYRKQYG